jgi:hypothetical protein
MVPATFANFFLATAGAGGALIGLLFVAISINPERIVSSGAPRERQAVASGAFTALVNAFFVSTAALIPGSSIGVVASILAALGLINTLRIGAELGAYQVRRYRRTWRDLALRIFRAAFLTVFSLVLYGLEFTNAWDLLHNPHTTGDVYGICAMILAIYGVGLARAWELLGAPRSGLFAFLNPLRDIDETDGTPPAPTVAPAQSGTTTAFTSAAVDAASVAPGERRPTTPHPPV